MFQHVFVNIFFAQHATVPIDRVAPEYKYWCTFSMNSSSAGAWNSSSTAEYFSTSVKRLTAKV